MVLTQMKSKASVTPVVSYEYNIMDLASNTNTVLESMAKYWSFNGNFNPSVTKVYDCSANLIIGMLTGFSANDYIERTYTNLGSHNIIYYSIRILPVNGWQAGDKIKIQLDGTVIADWEPSTAAAGELIAFCGDTTLNDLSVFIVGKLFHTGSTLTLRISSHITSGSTTATFGIRGIRMSLGSRKANDVEGMCLRMLYRASPSNCLCESGFTEDPANAGQCIACATGMVQCFGPGTDQGYGCVTGYSYNGNSCVACPSGCEACLGTNTSVCLLCSASQVLYWDNTCAASCNSPYFLRTENGYQFCDICQTGYFRYPNNTCLPTCEAPRKQRVSVSSYFCDSPCSSSSSYYYVSDGQCKAGCAYPNEIRDGVFCVLALAEAEVKQAQAMGGALGVGSKITGAASAVAGALSSGDPGAFCLATLSEMLHYIRYMKIMYPPKVQFILDQDQPPLFDLVPDMTEEMVDSLPHNILPEKFEKYGLESCFLINFWEPGIKLVGLLIVGVFLSSAFEKCLKSKNIIYTMFKKIRETVKWNFYLMYLISYLEDVVMSSSFEFRTASFDSALPILSFSLCLIVNIIVAFVIGKMISVVLQLWKIKRKAATQSDASLMREKLKEYDILFEECKEDSLLSLCFMLFFVLKVYLFYFTIAYLFDYPRAQTVIITSLSLLMVLYLVLTRPLKKRLNLYQYIIQEVIILLVNICALILSFLDLQEVDAFEPRKIIGEALIGCDMAFSAFGVVCLIGSIGATLYGLYQAIKKRINRKKANSKNKISSAVVPYPTVSVLREDSQSTSVNTSIMDPKLLRGKSTEDSVNFGLIFPMSRPLTNYKAQREESDISFSSMPISPQLSQLSRRSAAIYLHNTLEAKADIVYDNIPKSKRRKM